jgi:murein DD-endopeptidase MepM/ murein hydrolase activator NlpD
MNERMKKKRKILLSVFISITIIAAGFGGFALYKFWPATWSKNPPVIILPIQNFNVIDCIWGYGDHNGSFHNGIDFGCNASVDVYAWCKLRVVEISTWFNADGGHWQTNILFRNNWQYSFDVAFESWALNESYANLQRNQIIVKINQIIEQGTKIGTLLFHGSGTHIHFGMKKGTRDICAYSFFSNSSKVQFHNLWDRCGFGDDSWYND